MTIPSVDALADVFASAGARDYLGEPVTVAEHLLQCGALARAAGAPAPLVAAALLHDVGHLLSAPGVAAPSVAGAGVAAPGVAAPGVAGADGSGDEYGDVRHGAVGAGWLSAWFPPSVTEPVRLHVAAKRYLCGTDPGYFGLLSPASVRTLELQGGPMAPEEAVAFAERPHAADAVAVRRWDDAAKDPEARPPGFESFRGLLEGLLLPG